MATDSNALSESALQDLAERIEAADGPDADLDREIMLAVGYLYEQRDIGCRYEDGSVALDWVYVDPVTDKWRSTHPLEFSASLDAAMTLVATIGDDVSATFWRLGNDGEGGDPSLFKAEVLVVTAYVSKQHIAVAATPALALCAAALRARHPKG